MLQETLPPPLPGTVKGLASVTSWYWQMALCSLETSERIQMPREGVCPTTALPTTLMGPFAAE